MSYRRHRSFGESMTDLGELLWLLVRFVSPWFGGAWFTMLLVGNLYHSGFAPRPVGYWETFGIIAPVYFPIAIIGVLVVLIGSKR